MRGTQRHPPEVVFRPPKSPRWAGLELWRILGVNPRGHAPGGEEGTWCSLPRVSPWGYASRIVSRPLESEPTQVRDIHASGARFQ